MATSSEKPLKITCRGDVGALSTFLVYSSTSGTYGLSRGTDYTTSNASMNCLLRWREMQGLTQTITCWGLVLETGLGSGYTGDPMFPVREAPNLSDRIWEFRKVFNLLMTTGKPGLNPFVDGMMLGLIEMTTSYSLKPYELEQSNLWPEEQWHTPDDPEDCLYTVEKAVPATMPIDLATTTQTSSWALTNPKAARKTKEVADMDTSVVVDDELDKVLLIAHVPVSTKKAGQETAFSFTESGGQLGPKFRMNACDPGTTAYMTFPYLDKPGTGGRRSDYTLSCRGDEMEIPGGRPHQLSAYIFPDKQTSLVSLREPSVVDQGRWYNVPGMMVTVCSQGGEKILVTLTCPYVAMWNDASVRGCFRLVRDGVSVHSDLGGAVLTATEEGIKNTAVISLIDSPGDGFHIYQLQAMVHTHKEEAVMMEIDDEMRQMVVVRLPSSTVVGPTKPGKDTKATVIDSPEWTALPGMTLKATLKASSDQALILFDTNLIPLGNKYETFFTVVRTDASGTETNLGHESEGLWSLSSAAKIASLHPSTMFVDKPGAGTFKYTVKGLAKEGGALAGPRGQISAMITPTRA